MKKIGTGAILVASILAAVPVRADKIDDVLSRLARLEAENSRLRARVQSLEGTAVPRVPRTSTARAPLTQPAVPMAVAIPAVSPSSFDGAYLGAFGGAVTRDRQYGAPAGSSSDALALPSVSARLPATGGYGGAFVGYGQTVGLFYGGLEARGFAKDQRSTVSGSVEYGQFGTRPIPFVYATSFGSVSPPVSAPPSLIVLQRVATPRLRIADVGGADASVRLGLIVADDLLVYTRLGGGVEFYDARASNAAFETVCTSPITRRTVSGLSTTDSVVGCGSTNVNRSSASSNFGTAISPYLLTGLGVEKTFGSLFVRAEAELVGFLGGGARSINSSAPAVSVGQYYEARFNGSVGYRW